MPTYNHNVSYGLQDLLEYLALLTDGEMFTVTNTRELSACSDIGNQWLCPITCFPEGDDEQHLCNAIFKNDPTRKQLCSHTLTLNRGIYSAYLGGRKWLYSGSQDMDITYIFPESKTTKRGSVIVKKTAVIEVSPVCTVRARDSMVPSSFRQKRKLSRSPKMTRTYSNWDPGAPKFRRPQVPKTNISAKSCWTKCQPNWRSWDDYKLELMSPQMIKLSKW